jgi:hypothetical protein
MSHDLPPVGFEPHDPKSPLTAPWEPIYRNAQGAWVVLGVQIRAAHTNSRVQNRMTSVVTTSNCTRESGGGHVDPGDCVCATPW